MAGKCCGWGRAKTRRPLAPAPSSSRAAASGRGPSRYRGRVSSSQPLGSGVAPNLESTYASLPERFGVRQAPTPVAAPRLLRLNRPLAQELGLDAEYLESPAGVAMLAGNAVPEGARPLAMAYAGHQFGNFVPSLGDGRALLLGEVVDAGGVRRDLHLKGSGPTPFSRRGDGRAALGPVLREYLVSESMHALGIPSTRALAMVETGERVRRDALLPGAVLTRVAACHVRVGTFEYFASRRDGEAVRTLADYVIERLYPEARDAPNPYRTLLDAVIGRQAELVARWLHVGFIHGVMNTDNTAVSGETIDYGPCAFMDAYHPSRVYSSIDHGGRYAYENQPGIAQWNLARLCECLLPCLDEDEEAALESAREALSAFASHFDRVYHAGLLGKLGIEGEREGDRELASRLLALMAEGGADFTNTFRGLAEAHADAEGGPLAVRELFDDPAPFDAWSRDWQRRLAQEGRDDAERRRAMCARNPAVIPRNHRVEQAIEAAAGGDLEPALALLDAVTRPFEGDPDHARFRSPPEPHEVVRQTFCGT